MPRHNFEPARKAHFRSDKGALPRSAAVSTVAHYISTDRATITIAAGKIVMILPKPLKGLNKHGGSWKEFGERRAWEVLVGGITPVTDGSIGTPATGRRRLEI